jgi:antitoxin VapB
LPKSVAFPSEVQEVEITRLGRSLIVSPIGTSWADYFEQGPHVSDDFMCDREDWGWQHREPL